MVFSSAIFLFAFFPLTFLVYYSLRDELKNYWLLVVSIVFYAWGEPKYVFLLLASTIVNYTLGRMIECWTVSVLRVFHLWVAVIWNLGILIYFKYSAFFLEVFYRISKLDFRDSILAFDGSMPIGISFFTFQILSYVIDVYRRDVPVQKNILNLALYIMLFPQMIAGPIVRYSDVEKEIHHREISSQGVYLGLRRFMIGISKKVLLANTMAVVADYAYANIGVSCALSWLGAICYTLQIYYDFSGYSDMAIGMGHMAGFHFQENFKTPYISLSMKDFWRRWHVSLSSWFRDYLYIPLGGNRRGTVRTYINLVIVFFVTGLWHGASFNFIVWGLFHGFFLCLERIHSGHWQEKLPIPVRHIYTMLIVTIGWFFFRADTLKDAMVVLGTMIRPSLWNLTAVYPIINREFVFFFICSLALVGGLPTKFRTDNQNWPVPMSVFNSVTFFVSVLYIIGSDFNPFIYYRF